MLIFRYTALLSVVTACLVTVLSAQAQTDSPAVTVDTLRAGLQAGEVNTNPLFQTPVQRRVTFANIEQFAPTRTLRPGANAFPFKPAPALIDRVEVTVDDGFGERQFTVAAFLQRKDLMGLAVVSNGNILLEHYAPDHSANTPWISFSVTKSISSMLIGAAIHDGYIQSVDDPIVQYLPRLRGSAYEAVTLRHLLHMASGVAWSEDYANPQSDVAVAGAANGIALTSHLATKERVAEPGARFNYNTGEANLVGEVLRAALANAATPYANEKLWQGMGMASNAYWLLDEPLGRETGGCCIAATVLDYVRMGVLALNDGVLPNGERVLPEGWMALSTTPSPALPDYGFMWWLTQDERFYASGIFGQKIFIDPLTNTVIGVHSNAEKATGTPYNADLQSVLIGITDAIRAEQGL